MIHIHLDAATLANARIAISPLHELVGGLELLHRHQEQAPWPYTNWAAHAAGILRTTPALAPLRVYADLYGKNHDRRTPDLFAPVPQTPAPRLQEQLRELRETPPALVHEQFAMHYPEGVPSFLKPYQQRGPRAFQELTDALQAFWELALAPYWPAMRVALEEEVLLRSRALAAQGPGSLLTDLRGHLVWEPPVLSLQRVKESTLVATDQRLLLVPRIFAQERVTCSTDHRDVLMIVYQARGEALLSPAPVVASELKDDRLSVLLGTGRARILRALVEPATTSGLAAVLGLAPSTVSEHLTALQGAGVVSRRRSGQRVFYALEPMGSALLQLLSGGGREAGEVSVPPE